VCVILTCACRLEVRRVVRAGVAAAAAATGRPERVRRTEKYNTITN